MLESLSNLQQGELSEAEGDDGDDDITDLQAVFNVLAQVDIEKAKAMDDKRAMAQFWKGLGSSLWNAGKSYFKNKYCTEEQEMKSILQEVTGQQAMQDKDNEITAEDDDKVKAELQSLFSALKKVEAKMMQDGENDNVIAEGWWKKLSRRIKKGAKKYLC